MKNILQKNEKILIIDFGSQVTQLIARRIRENGVYCEIVPYRGFRFQVSGVEETSLPRLRGRVGVGASISNSPLLTSPRKRGEEMTPNTQHSALPHSTLLHPHPNPPPQAGEGKISGIILSGGPASIYEKNSPTISDEIFKSGLPILGICYGEQLMCSLLGGEVKASKEREYGKSFVSVKKDSALTRGVWRKGEKYQVWMSHGDKVTELPEGFDIIATTENAPFAVISDEKRKFYAVQFHPEVAHTPDGAKLLKNFTHKICGCKGDWTMHSFLENKVRELHEQIGKKRVICGVSGGVDSTVVAAILHKAIGKQLICIFVDHGLCRKDEAKQVRKMFSKFHIPLIQVDKSALFLSKLKNVSDPEKKRKIIGKTFIDVFDEEAAKVKDAEFLAQGTLYPDVIESVSVHGDASVTIKSHHNVGGLPKKMKLKLVEPLRELFKDEVRELGRELGLSDEMVKRHPFPGPGLAIRIPGEITAEKIRILQEADAIYIEEIRKAGLYDKIWQAFAVLLPVRSVGVMGDGRTYDYVCALRAVTSTDGMTADYYPFTHEFLGRVSNHIVNKVKGINRVVYDITSKPPGTIEWE